MKFIIGIALAIASIVAGYFLYNSIAEPIVFKKEKETREAAVSAKLEKIRTAQEIYFDVKKEYANSFDSLKLVLKSDSFTVKQFTEGEGDQIIMQIVKVPAIDSVLAKGIVLADLEAVPFSDGKSFEMEAKVIDIEERPTPVVETRVKKKYYLGEYAADNYLKYDSDLNPEDYMLFGNLNEPTLTGNW